MERADVCSTCIFAAESPHQKGTLECRSNPPTPIAMPGQHPMTGQPTIQIMAFHPAVQPGHWCGDHQPDENGPEEPETSPILVN